jgi:hypothetical protein
MNSITIRKAANYTPPTKQTLSSARRHLVELMQEINFGRIEGFSVRNGEPIFEPSSRILREVVFGKMNAPNPARAKEDFILKDQILQLFNQLDRAGTATIQSLVVQNGLPIRMTVVGSMQTH